MSDTSSTAPHLRYAAGMDEGGRGLFLVAQFAERWGTRYTDRRQDHLDGTAVGMTGAEAEHDGYRDRARTDRRLLTSTRGHPMATPEIGTRPAEFRLSGGILTGDTFERRDYALSEAAGHPVVLAFYPGDDTPVCTKQMCSYSSGLERFTELDAVVWGISPQDVDSHEAFARKHGLKIPLLADPDRRLAREFGIVAPGLGLRRAVFLLDATGTLRWKHVALLGATYQSVDTLSQQLAALAAG